MNQYCGTQLGSISHKPLGGRGYGFYHILFNLITIGGACLKEQNILAPPKLEDKINHITTQYFYIQRI